MNDEILDQGPPTEPESEREDSSHEVEEIDLYLEDDDLLHGPESWREIPDTLADPVDPG